MRFLLEFHKRAPSFTEGSVDYYTSSDTYYSVSSQADIFDRLMRMRSRKTLQTIAVSYRKDKTWTTTIVNTDWRGKSIEHPIHFDPSHLNDPDRLDELSGQIWNWLILRRRRFDRSGNPIPKGFRKKKQKEAGS